ncbi:MAG: UvrB/UvrC motif-containing protein [Butyrivibrio sp.]
MLCEKCRKNTATFHYTEVIGNNKSEHHLCGECAANSDLGSFSGVFDTGLNFAKLLSGILGGNGLFASDEQEDPARTVSCPTCKMTYGEFIKNSSFGCADCYDVFGPLITDTIKKIQGSDRHVGKKPMLYGMHEEHDTSINRVQDSKDIDKEIDFLSKRLKEAVNEEDFTEAARLRDRINELKKGKEDNNA